MNFNLGDLTVQFSENNSHALAEDWAWLIGSNAKVILVSAIGDMFYESENKIYWLDIGRGKTEKVAESLVEFEHKLKNIELVNEWFMVDLTTDLRLSDKKLKEGQVYSYIKLPVIGGDYSIDNFLPIDIEVHFSFAAQIHKQIKDLPDGTDVKIKLAPFNTKAKKQTSSITFVLALLMVLTGLLLIGIGYTTSWGHPANTVLFLIGIVLFIRGIVAAIKLARK